MRGPRRGLRPPTGFGPFGPSGLAAYALRLGWLNEVPLFHPGFAPIGGKKLVAFIDDLNMPQKSTFGFMPPLELLKLWVDNGFWYDREKCEVKHIKELQLMASMAPPGGGRSAFSQRVSACFALINMTAPNDDQLKRIFGTILNKFGKTYLR